MTKRFSGGVDSTPAQGNITIALDEDVKIPATDPEAYLDPYNAFEAALIDMVKTHRKKGADYAGGLHPNQNFYDTGVQVGVPAGASVETLIATKQARLKVLLPRLWTSGDADPQNESIRDSLLDRAVYSVIALTLWDEGGYQTNVVPEVE